MYFAEALVSTAMSVIFYLVLKFFFARFVTKGTFSFFSASDITSIMTFAGLVFVINFYWIDSVQKAPETKNVAQTVASGQSFTAPEIASIQKPLNINLDLGSDSDHESIQTEIVTPLARYVFSSYGASLQSMDLRWQNGTVSVPVVQSQVPSCIIAFSEQTPTQYELVRNVEMKDLSAHLIEYRANFEGATVYKTFVVHHNTYQIDVKLLVEGSGFKSQEARMFLASPTLSEEVKGIVNKPSTNQKVKVQDVALNKDHSFHEFWFEPKLFGFTTKFLTTICFDATPRALERAYFKKISDTQFQAILESKSLSSDEEISWSLYVGPRVAESLTAVNRNLESLMQYGLLTPIVKPAFRLMNFLYDKTNSYGLVIILLALLIKLVLLPFTLKSERSMKQQAEFEKKRAHLQQKFKHDKAALDQATAELINKYGFPMLSGCLPMLLNFPVFLALNKVLSSAIQLHGAPFLWLPDLSAADPYYVLSMLVVIAMVASPVASVDPRQWASRIGFALFLGAVTAYLASGLALFIMMNTVLGVVQTYAMKNIRWFRQ